jgi:hypothetical protein
MLHQWFMFTDPVSYHDAARMKHEPTTGSWFLDGDIFEDWKNGKSNFVWIHGIREYIRLHQQDDERLISIPAGCGKSILW